MSTSAFAFIETKYCFWTYEWHSAEVNMCAIQRIFVAAKRFLSPNTNRGRPFASLDEFIQLLAKKIDAVFTVAILSERLFYSGLNGSVLNESR